MKDLILSELRRFRWLALTAFTAHLLVLLFLNRISDLFQQSYLDALPMLFTYMAAGLAFSVAQIGGYRKPSQWAWLIHRPLAPSRIFGSMALSALALLGFVVFLPMLLLLIGTDLLTSRVVDLRHYLEAVHVLAFTMMAWMAGTHACLARSRFAIAVIFAPLVLALHLVSTVALLIPVSIALAWLTWIALKSFRADRDAPIRGDVNLVVSALPLQFGLFLLCVALWRFAFVTGSIMLGVDPLNTEFPPEGGLIATERAEPAQEMTLACRRATTRELRPGRPSCRSWNLRGSLPTSPASPYATS